MGGIINMYAKGIYVDNPYRNFYEIKAYDLNRNLFTMKNYLNKVLIIVNVSPFDPDAQKEFEKLEELKKKFNDNVEILLFPCLEFDKKEIENKELINELKKYSLMNNFKLFNRVNVSKYECAEIFKFCLRNSMLFELTRGKAKPLPNNFSKVVFLSEIVCY